MIPTADFLRECADRCNRYLPDELLQWILVMFNDEPFEDFYDAYTMEGLVCGFCDSYSQGLLDVTIPSPEKLLRDRYEDLKAMVADMLIDLQYLQEMNNRYEEILKEHHLL